jgi:hypothetical protein
LTRCSAKRKLFDLRQILLFPRWRSNSSSSIERSRAYVAVRTHPSCYMVRDGSEGTHPPSQVCISPKRKNSEMLDKNILFAPFPASFVGKIDRSGTTQSASCRPTIRRISVSKIVPFSRPETPCRSEVIKRLAKSINPCRSYIQTLAKDQNKFK